MVGTVLDPLESAFLFPGMPEFLIRFFFSLAWAVILCGD